MKKLLLTTFLTVLTAITFAQGYYGGSDTKITFGIMGGANMAFFQAKLPPGSMVSNDPTSVGSIGINADIKFSDYLSVRPGIFYSGKGGDIQFTAPDVNGLDHTVENKISLYYLEVPVTLIGHLPLSDSFNILVGAGPYVAMGLNGKNVNTDNFGSQTNKIKFGSNGDLKSTDFGATGLLGFETESGIIVGVNYDMGFSNILNKSNSGEGLQSLKNSAIYVSIGFNL